MTSLRLERHVVADAHRSGYESDLEALLDAMRDAEGVLWADAGPSLTETGVFTVLSEWRTEADLDRFVAGASYAAFADANDVRLTEPAGVRRFSDG